MFKNSQTNITIKDIARKYKCSPSTVSRALNNHLSISKETRNTIQEYALKMGYQRNNISLSLLNKSSKTLGVILPNINHFHEAAMLEGLQSAFQPLGYLLNICVTNESYELEKLYIERLLSNRADGIFISISQETYENRHFEHIENALKRNIPIINIDRKIENSNTQGVVIDDYDGAYQATQHLIDMGCRHIAHLKGPEGNTVAIQRFKGYFNCLQKNNIAINSDLIINTNFEVEAGIEPTKYLLDLPQKPDAIFGVNDHVCIGAMHVIRERNVLIPNDIAIVGFDDSPIAKYFCPPLSSVQRKSHQIGIEASKLFLKNTDSFGKLPINNIVLPATLIVRDSSKRQ